MKTIAEFGAMGVVCYLLVWLVQRVVAVIENNTAALTRMSDQGKTSHEAIIDHSGDAKAIFDVAKGVSSDVKLVAQVQQEHGKTLARIEQSMMGDHR